MIVIDGKWIPQGTNAEASIVRSSEQLEEYVEHVGFLPLFEMPQVPSFSAEAVSPREFWWTGGELDPWSWRAEIAARGNVAYGKFFCGKAGFISREWFPVFAAFRRDGYDFDARFEDGLATDRERAIIETLERYALLPSYELKSLAGFGKNGRKGYDSVLTNLQMQTYVVTRGFRRKVNKKGEEYGWAVADYCLAQELFGAEHVRSRYDISSQQARDMIVCRVLEFFPDADEKNVKKLIK